MKRSLVATLGSWTRIVRAISTALSHALAFVAALTLAVITIFFGVAVAMRYIFNDPVIGDVEIVSFMLAIMLPLTFAYCAVRKGHVEVSVIVSRLTPRVQAILKCVTNGITLFFLIMVVYGVAAQSLVLWKNGIASVTFRIPFFPFALVAMLGFIAFALVTVADILDSLLEGIRK